MKEKYISFDSWWGGFSNVRMSYELVAAISIITNRTIILPPKVYCLFFSNVNQKSTFFDIWNILDKEAFTSQFKCVEYKDVPEYALLENDYQYFENVNDIAIPIMFGDSFKQSGTQQPVGNSVIINNIDDIDDFNKFSINREIVNVNYNNKFIHFPRNLFGHFYYHVYGNGAYERNLIKEKIKNGIVYKKQYFDLAETIKSKIGEYNAIHVRRNDFVQVRPEYSIPQLDNLIYDIEFRIPNNIPLYIATDENDKSLFNPLKEKYDIYFLEDFFKELNSYESLAIDQIICSKADIFLGSKLSTFSDYINIMRGYSGKKDFHREGTNFKMHKLVYDTFPWEVEGYGWEKVYSYCWELEK
jgi:hypothetical protein